MINWDAHLIIGPIVLPMVIASAMLLLDCLLYTSPSPRDS